MPTAGGWRSWPSTTAPVAMGWIRPPAPSKMGSPAIQGCSSLWEQPDSLPEIEPVDLIIFGFCLYLCDPQDLFRIAAGSDALLADRGLMTILISIPRPATIATTISITPISSATR